MLNLLLAETERKMNALENAKHKLLLPKIFELETVEEEVFTLTENVDELMGRLEKISKIEVYKDLLCKQLTEYITILDKEPNIPFSKSQGYIGNHHFYVKPLIDIKTILFNDLRGLFGVSIYSSLNENDQVNDREKFRNFILEKRKQINESKNMYDLFEICHNYIKEIKKDFC